MMMKMQQQQQPACSSNNCRKMMMKLQQLCLYLQLHLPCLLLLLLVWGMLG
jgi:hypothetical protein